MRCLLGALTLACLAYGTVDAGGLGLAFTPSGRYPSFAEGRRCLENRCRYKHTGLEAENTLGSRVGRLASRFFKGQWHKTVSSKKRGARRTGAAGARAMFTGIVEEVGEVDGLLMDIKTPGVTLTIKGKTVLDGAYEGCSISVNGVCLTVTVS